MQEKYNWKESGGSIFRCCRSQNGKTEMNNFNVITTEKGVLIKAWTRVEQRSTLPKLNAKADYSVERIALPHFVILRE
jgi:hypothetical protein